MTEGTILQNLRDFTVQIRRPDSETIVGTGIAVSLDGRIVTCAHVVEAAIGVHPRAANGTQIGVYFPQARGDEAKARHATVAACFPSHDDDVVVLQLDSPPPLAPQQMPKLGTAEPSAFNPFRSYGYRRLAKYLAGHAHGDILDLVEPPIAATLYSDPVQLDSKQINQGMSGAGVLDIKRNLVVGIISEVWRAKADGIDQGTAWAVNGRVLSLPPLGIELQDAPLPKQAAAQPQPQYVEAAKGLLETQQQSQFHAAPPPLAEWVGRADLLAGLDHDYADPERRVTGLIGFGGEGKSSLARRWVDVLDALPKRPTGIFWWGFYDNNNVDEFFEAALEFISGGSIDPRRIPSSSAKAQVVAAMLANGRYLFVLDGLEVLQRQEGDQYGLLTSPDLQTFLELFAAPGHNSFCLVTSRAPLLDLMAYTSYIHRDVRPVSLADGRSLLRALGVKGRDEELDTVTAQWDGHALTLSLLGTYLAWQHDGAVAYADEFDVGVWRAKPLPTDVPDAAKQRYAHVHRVLRRYDEHLTDAERAFLIFFSAFRTPVSSDAFARVFRTPPTASRDGLPTRPTLQAVLVGLDDGEFDALVARLVGYRLLRFNADANTYTTHPLVRNHYLARLTGSGQAAQIHDQLKAYYLDLAGDTPNNPTLEQLAPLIEVIYHACRAEAYDEAFRIHDERIMQKNSAVLVYKLGAYETELALMYQFFRDGDTSQEPQVSKASDKSWILNTVGLCHMSLGRLETAVSFYEYATELSLELEDWSNASTDYQNRAALNVKLGRLAASGITATQALQMAHRAANKEDEINSLARQAWAAHLLGRLDVAGEAFSQAEALEREINRNVHYLYSLRGTQHAEHLRRIGDVNYGQRVIAANLKICEHMRWTYHISLCRRELGELDAFDGQNKSARTHFDSALTIARSISHRDVLIEALLARGRWGARSVEARRAVPLQQAFSDLNEALGYASDGGYRIYEADIRIALAWAHLASGTVDAAKLARQEATRARSMSQDMGYHWGQVDADELLAAIA